MLTARPRRLAAAAAGLTVLLAGFAPVGPADAAGQPPVGVRAGLGHPDPPHMKQWWYDALRLSQAHRITTGRGVTVAVVGEDGANLQVPDLRGADVRIGTDCMGYPARSTRTFDAKIDHGTRMAADIVGTGRGPGPGGVGMLGVAPGAHVVVYPFYDPCTYDDVRHQVVEAARHGADIISCSDMLGGDWGPTVREVNRLGAVLVAAGGNAGQGQGFILPARERGVVAVHAVDRQARAWKDNTFVSQAQIAAGSGYPVIAAPGVDNQADGWFKGYGWSAGVYSGTSESAAIVSGLLALVKSRYPDATANQLIQQLIHYTGGGAAYAWDAQYGFGIASATEMLKHDPTQWPDENPLWLTPQQALTTYPMTVRGRQHVLETPAASPKASPGAATSRSGRPADAGAAAAAESGGVPAAVWVAIVLVAVLGAAGAIATRRRRPAPGADAASTTTTDRHKQGV